MKHLILAATLLAGTHLAQAVQPSYGADLSSPAVPIQYYYGPPPPYYVPPPYIPRGPGWYGPRVIQPYDDMDPEDLRRVPRWQWEFGRPHGVPPWAGRRW